MIYYYIYAGDVFSLGYMGHLQLFEEVLASTIIIQF